MLCYWILRRPDGTPAGLMRIQDDRARLSLSAPIAGHFTLFSKNDAVPIVPESETVLPGPEAVLGTDGDRVTCFAASNHAAPLAAYRSRLSRLYTIEEQKPASASEAKPSLPDMSLLHTINERSKEESKDDSANISSFHTIQVNSISESARDAQAFSLLLQRADTFYAAYDGDPTDNMVQKKDIDVSEAGGIDLFSQEYPGARWRYVEGTDVLPHYEGTWKQPNGQTLHILAVRGHAAPRPPRALLGFTRFLRDHDGTGYWLRLTPLP